MIEQNSNGTEAIEAGAKRIWIEPSMDVIASVSDVAGKVGADVDEDFTGIPIVS